MCWEVTFWSCATVLGLNRCPERVTPNAAGHGWPRARTILTAVHHGNIPAALAALDDSHAELARERESIAAATHAFTQAAGRPAPAIRRQARIGQVATDIGVRTPGGFAFPIIDAAIATMRSNGSLDHALAHLSRRDEQVHHLSLRRLRASAALHAYLARYYSPQ